MLLKKYKLTYAAVSIIAVFTVMQFVFPGLLGLMQREPKALSSGEWWRLITPVLINRGGWAEIEFNFLCLILVGITAEHYWGHLRWLTFFIVGSIVGEAVGMFWRPIGAGSSVAVSGLLGALTAGWLCSASWYMRGSALVVLSAAVGLTVACNLHGPPLLVDAGLGAWILRRKRKSIIANDLNRPPEAYSPPRA